MEDIFKELGRIFKPDYGLNLRINKDELFFVDVPEEIKEFVIVNYGFAGMYLMEKNSKNLNAWKISIPTRNYQILGFTKEVIVEKDINEKNFVLRILK